MNTGFGRRQAAFPTTHSVARMLIASYFIARVLGLSVAAAGDELVPFRDMPGEYSELVAAGVLLILSLAMFFGVQVRLAALLLAVHLFWTSFLMNYLIGTTPMLDAFWRDLALIGALSLVAAQPVPRASAQIVARRLSDRLSYPRRVVASGPPTTLRPKAA